MHANNEVGVVLPTAEIGSLARERGILFHTDAVQSVGQIPIHVRELPCDFLSMSAHKIYGPKGVGLLYRRIGVPFHPLIYGGDQEFGLRAGTENVPGIAGLGRALELAYEGLEAGEPERLRILRDRFVRHVLEAIPDCELTGDPTRRLPNHASFCFHGIEGEPLQLNLDMQGIAASTGAACASGEIEPSHVLLAMGYSREAARGALRITLGRLTSAAEMDEVATLLPRLVGELRRLDTRSAAMGRAAG
jgi:cysteine desulfurase